METKICAFEVIIVYYYNIDIVLLYVQSNIETHARCT